MDYASFPQKIDMGREIFSMVGEEVS